MPTKNPHAVILGRKGGQAKSARKTAAAKRNALISAYVRAKRRAAEQAPEK